MCLEGRKKKRRIERPGCCQKNKCSVPSTKKSESRGRLGNTGQSAAALTHSRAHKEKGLKKGKNSDSRECVGSPPLRHSPRLFESPARYKQWTTCRSKHESTTLGGVDETNVGGSWSSLTLGEKSKRKSREKEAKAKEKEKKKRR